MKFLLDTHLLLWAASEPTKLSKSARNLIESPQHVLLFSSVSLWEVAIKNDLGREDFQVDARLLRRGLLDNGYHELAMSSLHAVTISQLPAIHKDPFDRILIAQSMAEGITLLTSDPTVAQYPGSLTSSPPYKGEDSYCVQTSKTDLNHFGGFLLHRAV